MDGRAVSSTAEEIKVKDTERLRKNKKKPTGVATICQRSARVLQAHSINSQDDEIKQHDPAEFWVTGAEPLFNGQAFPARGLRSSGRTDLSKGWVKID